MTWPTRGTREHQLADPPPAQVAADLVGDDGEYPGMRREVRAVLCRRTMDLEEDRLKQVVAVGGGDAAADEVRVDRPAVLGHQHRECSGLAVPVAEQRIAWIRHRDLRGGAGLHTLVILSTPAKVSGKFGATQMAAAGRVAGAGATSRSRGCGAGRAAPWSSLWSTRCPA
jgi:hypothetical protein